MASTSASRWPISCAAPVWAAVSPRSPGVRSWSRPAISARPLILCPPDLALKHLPTVIADAEVDAIVTSGQMDAAGGLGVRLHAVCHPAIAPLPERPAARQATEWVMFTSGTTGAPKMVVH